MILDESTSALDENNEKNAYELLNKFKIKYISVGHKANLNNFHELALTLSINDQNKIEEI